MLGILLVSAGLITLEIGITRIFSTMIWYHLSFLAVSLALLGFTLGGLLLLAFPSLLRRESSAVLSACSFLFALAVALGTLYIYRQPSLLELIRALSGRGANAAAVFYFVFLLLLFVTAFFFSGLTIAAALSRQAENIARVYFANLFGSGLGCLLIILLLSRLGALHALLAAAAMAAAGSLCFLERLPRSTRRPWLLLDGILLIAVLTPFFLADRQTVFTRSLFTRRDVTEQNRLYRQWNAFSCVDFYKPDPGSEITYSGETASAVHEGLWGLSRRYQGKLPEPIKVIIDSWAITSINRMEADTLELPLYDYLPSNLAYQIKERPRVLVLGAGGGIDVLSALHYGSPLVRAVEINPAIVEAVRTRFAEFAGHLYDRPDVEAVVAEGRHWVNKDPSSYDLIQLSGVDTLSGAQASSYSFSESYLYTLEAFEEYLAHLEPDGVVTFLRFAFRKPREMLRLFTTAVEALERQGVRDPGKHLFVVHSNVLIFANLMIKKSPFTPEEAERLRRFITDKGFRVLYAPYQEGDSEFHQYLRSPDREGFLASYPFRVEPVSDDNPFFFNYTRLADLIRPPDEKLYWLYWVGQTILFYGLGLTLLLAVVYLFLPLLAYRLRGTVIPGSFRFIAYFLALGIGFLCVEILLMQRFTLFLGQPIYALALVLFCMLVFAGGGSLCSQRIELKPGRTIPGFFALLILCLLALYLLTGPVFRLLLKEHLAVRIAASVALLAPPSFLLGFPFPLGIRLADRHARPMVPWGWVLNGYASVVGSFAGVAMGMHLGFTRVYLLALGVYALAGACLTSLAKQLEPGTG